MFIFIKNDRIAFSLGKFHGNDFFFERTVVSGSFSIVMASQRNTVHLFSADIQVLSDELCGVTHDIGFSLEIAQRRLFRHPPGRLPGAV